MKTISVILAGVIIFMGCTCAALESAGVPATSAAVENRLQKDHPDIHSDQAPKSDPGNVPGQAENSSAAPMTDIHDIKPLVSVPVPVSLGVILLWIGIGLLAALLALGAWFFWKRRRGKTVESLTAMLSPEDTAFQQLSALSLDTTGGKAFYFRLSAIFRQYLEGRFGIDGLEMTTEELLPRVDTLALERDLKRDAKTFLVSCDPVKFAGLPVSRPAMESDLGFVRGFVEKSATYLLAPEEEATAPLGPDELE